MKVSTRIIAGYVVLILVTVAVFSYQVYMILQLNEINIQLSKVNVENALKSLQLQYDERMIEDFAQKYYGTGDPIYKDLFEDYGRVLETDLMNLEPTVTSEAELEAIRKVSRSWKAVQAILGAEQRPEVVPKLTEHLTELLATLRADTIP